MCIEQDVHSVTSASAHSVQRRTMRPGERHSGRKCRAPLLMSHCAFSQVTISSPKAASTRGLPESRAATLQTDQKQDHMLTCC